VAPQAIELLLTAVMLGLVVAVIAGPLRGSGRSRVPDPSESAALEVAKEVKYREILDAELDFHTGKLSEPDYREIDRTLRGEAIELLRRLEAGSNERR
jgi:hypothetical protein